MNYPTNQKELEIYFQLQTLNEIRNLGFGALERYQKEKNRYFELVKEYEESKNKLLIELNNNQKGI